MKLNYIFRYVFLIIINFYAQFIKNTIYSVIIFNNEKLQKKYMFHKVY